MSEPLQYSTQSSKEVARVVGNMAEFFTGEDEDLVVKACLFVALRLLIPNITLSQLVDGVKDASEWITLYGSSLTPTKGKVN